MFTVTLSSSLYLYLVFRKDFQIKPEVAQIKKLDPKESLTTKKEIIISSLILVCIIALVV